MISLRFAALFAATVAVGWSWLNYLQEPEPVVEVEEPPAAAASE